MPEVEQILAAPTKRFFVEMFTRDIELDEAILDLLDNCVDGILRLRGYKPDAERPYRGCHAHLKFSAREFSISDNCGGIPEDLIETAFRLGRPFGMDNGNRLPTVGVYGIGMKRAIFKLGRECTVVSRTKKSGFSVTFPQNWFTTEDNWELPITRLPGDANNPGTTITVRHLLPAIAQSFGSPTGFVEEFKAKVSQYYSVLMGKGFEVEINDGPVPPMPITFKVSDFKRVSEKQAGIAPYLFEGKVDGVSVELICGFYSPYSHDEDEDPTEFRSDEAGWTVVCNDRVVLYKDKTILTGWGDGTPNYHPQFRQIAGVVIFSSTEPELLPVTTTKRGIDANSPVYLKVRQKMRDGLRRFTSFTNRLKSIPAKDRKDMFRDTETVDLKTLRLRKMEIPAKNWAKDTKLGGKVFDPALPKFGDKKVRLIRFSRKVDDVRRVSKFVFDNPDESPADVGAACFDRILAEAKKQ
jgi:hypothetical protein